MLHLSAVRLIPAPLHRLALRLAHALRKIWWRYAQPTLVGVGVLLIDGEGRMLLVRHSYGSGLWSLPGGALGRHELPVPAAKREVLEELGCELKDVEPIGVNKRRLHGAPCVTHLYAAPLAADAPRADTREILEVAWFPPDDLPDGRTGIVDEAVWMARRMRG